jgi:hypothetical protein
MIWANPYIRLWLVVLALPSSSMASDSAAELAEAARSPETLHQFIQTHSALEWSPLLKTLGIDRKKITLPDCSEEYRCSSEIVAVPGPPAQAIVLVRHNYSMIELYLRFISEPQPDGRLHWRFAGHFNPWAKYFALSHRIFTFGGKPYLAATEQGISGTGLSSEVERWMDLTLSDFSAVFSYTITGEYLGLQEGRLSRRIHGHVASFKPGPIEFITVQYEITFDRASGRSVATRSDTLVFKRADGHKFGLDEKLSTASREQTKLFYGISEYGLTCEDFLRSNILFLKKLAAGAENDHKRELKQFLTECADTREKRQLTALLGKR